MSWLTQYRLKFYVRNSIWIFPSLAIMFALVTVSLLNRAERALGLEMNISPETARVVIGTVTGSMFTLVVIGCSAIMLAVQLASAQLSPRIILLVYRNHVRKFCLSVFVFTFTFSVAVLVRIEDSVPLLTSYLAAYGFLINLALFLYFVDTMGKTLRPSSALRAVGSAGSDVIASVYPLRFSEVDSSTPYIGDVNGNPRRVVHNEADGVVLAFDKEGLVSLAEYSNCVIQLVPAVGDFVAAGDPLFRLYDGGETLTDESLRGSVALGQERTLEQDPMFAFRIIVDIASKALSPAINDPTTAVLSIDQIHHLLRAVGRRTLAEGRETDSRGRLRLAYRTPNWDDFVHLAVTEIRHYGRESIQIMRRLRAMLENLIETLPEPRGSLLRQELYLLRSSAKRMFPESEDQALAQTADLQGMGSANGFSSKSRNEQPKAQPFK